MKALSVRFMDAVRAEFYSYIRFYKNNRAFLFAAFIWPYLMMMLLLGLGYLFGDPRMYAERLGVRSPVLFVVSASTVAMSSVFIIDEVAGYTLYNRWNGTLPYLILVPMPLSKRLLSASIPSVLLSPAISVISALPVAVYIEGLRGFMLVTSLYASIILGMLPLAGLSVIVAGLVLTTKEESNVASSLAPFMLLVSGVFYPVTILPKILQEVSVVVPVRYVVDIAKSLASTTAAGQLYVAIYALTLMAFAYNLFTVPLLSRVEARVRMYGFE